MLADDQWGAQQLYSKIAQVEAILPSLEQYCAELSTELSGIDVNQRMFRRLGGMWLLHVVHQIASMGTDRVGETELSRLTIPFDSWSHHRQYVSSASYRQQLASLVEHSGQGRATSISTAVTQTAPAPTMSRARQQLEKALQRSDALSRKVTIVRPYTKISAFQRTRAIWRSKSICTWNDLETKSHSAGAANLPKRLSLVPHSSSDDLGTVARAILPLVLPVGYAEGLNSLRVELEPLARQTAALYSANASQFHLPYQVLSAFWGEDGTKILSHQHGGHQGLDEICAAENYESRASERHYTFGWTDSRTSLKALPSAMPQRSRSSIATRLLFMSVASTEVIYRLQPFCLPSHVRRCASETRSFVDALVWPSLPVIRCGKSDIAELRLAAPVVYEDFAVPGTVSASKSALVVHNYFGVSWLETLALNVPTVCFVPEGIHRFRAAAQPFVDALARVGIIHYSGREAARFVNSLRGDPSAWWKSAEVQEARGAFVARYANFSDDWLDAWQDEFESLLAG